MSHYFATGFANSEDDSDNDVIEVQAEPSQPAIQRQRGKKATTSTQTKNKATSGRQRKSKTANGDEQFEHREKGKPGRKRRLPRNDDRLVSVDGLPESNLIALPKKGRDWKWMAVQPVEVYRIEVNVLSLAPLSNDGGQYQSKAIFVVSTSNEAPPLLQRAIKQARLSPGVLSAVASELFKEKPPNGLQQFLRTHGVSATSAATLSQAAHNQYTALTEGAKEGATREQRNTYLGYRRVLVAAMAPDAAAKLAAKYFKIDKNDKKAMVYVGAGSGPDNEGNWRVLSYNVLKGGQYASRNGRPADGTVDASPWAVVMPYPQGTAGAKILYGKTCLTYTISQPM